LRKGSFYALFLALEPRFYRQKRSFKNDAGCSNQKNGHRPPKETGRAGHFPTVGNKNMTEKLVTIGSYSTPYEANMVKSRLEAAGIPAFVADEYTIGMNWLYSNALGGVKVQVPESLALEAQELLNSGSESPTTDEFATVDTCPQCASKNTERFLDKRGSFLTWVLLGLPLLLPRKKKKCCDCGYRWKSL
jgi:hypothetical protein